MTEKGTNAKSRKEYGKERGLLTAHSSIGRPILRTPARVQIKTPFIHYQFHKRPNSSPSALVVDDDEIFDW